MPDPTDSPRARNRAETTRRISDAARAHLATDGPAGLSLRAVARDVGMVSSAVYRYFPSRDDLLTTLILDAYTAVADTVDSAESRVDRTDLTGRFLAVCHAFRDWAVAHPQEHALIFGSPVPGYRAPTATIDPAARIPLVLLAVLGDAARDGRRLTPTPGAAPATVHDDLDRLRQAVAPDLDDGWLARGILVWSQLVGLTSFELFGHLANVVEDHRAHFDLQMRTLASGLGLD